MLFSSESTCHDFCVRSPFNCSNNILKTISCVIGHRKYLTIKDKLIIIGNYYEMREFLNSDDKKSAEFIYRYNPKIKVNVFGHISK